MAVNLLDAAQTPFNLLPMNFTATTTYATPPSFQASINQTNFTTVSPSAPWKCNFYRMKGNRTYVVYGGYEGIPENLTINVILWIILLAIYSVLRKNAWNYNRIALVQRNEQKWTQLFYGDVDSAREERNGGTTENEHSESPEIATVTPKVGYFTWIIAIFNLTDNQIMKRCGPDAVQYLSFQRYIILYIAILCVFCLTVILPVNYQGNLVGNSKAFGHTTLSNLDPNSQLLWVHVAFSVILLILGVYVLQRFSASLKVDLHEVNVSRTLMISRIPRSYCNRDTLLRHFRQAYPSCGVQDIQLAYFVKDLIKLEKERENCRDAKLWSEAYFKATGRKLSIRPCYCSWFLNLSPCFSCVEQTDALTYYCRQEDIAASAVQRSRAAALSHALGICFVTFSNEMMSLRVYKDFRGNIASCTGQATTSIAPVLKPHRWKVSFAPLPLDIHWENLHMRGKGWYARAIGVNIILFIVLFFLTTPFIIVKSLDFLHIIEHLESLSALMSEFVPTLLLWTFAALLPVVVAYSDTFLSHWTRSSENFHIMTKTFIFLLFMVIILPSLGLTSAQAFFLWAFQPDGNQTVRYECIFLPDNGAFFVNYVITSAFIGTSLELIRFPELFLYLVHALIARSPAEMANIVRDIMWEFPYGTQYTWTLINFAMTVIYSLSCPVIVPFGLIYVCFKHCVDKHNIYFAYVPSKINKRIHRTAINFVVISLLLMQLSVVFFSVIRSGGGVNTKVTVMSLAVFSISLAVFIFQVCFNMFRSCSPLSYNIDEVNLRRDEEMAEPGTSNGYNEHYNASTATAANFIPTVLRPYRYQQGDSQNTISTAINSDNGSAFYMNSDASNSTNVSARKHYGTTDPSRTPERTNYSFDGDLADEVSVVIERKPSLSKGSSVEGRAERSGSQGGGGTYQAFVNEESKERS